MAYKANRLCTLQDVQDIWRPGTSQVDGLQKCNLKTVTVAFDRNKIYQMPHSPPKCVPLEQLGTKETEASKTDYLTPRTSASDTRQNVSAYRDYVTPTSTCAVDDTRSIHSNSAEGSGSPDRVSRTNILSRMAKTKASWVENQKLPEYIPQRKSPILCKGRPLGSSLLTPYMENKLSMDKGTKGVRDGKKFDLLPISKYLTQYRDERKFRKEKKLPLVRISSYHNVCGCLDGLGFWDCSEEEHDEQNGKHTATFFTTKDVFRPYHARVSPTKGEFLYVEPLQGKLNSYITDNVKLPRLHGSSGNDTFVTEPNGRHKATHSKFDARSRRNVSFPVIVS
ncbi:hypothetical protein OS493_017284 [Desmophyllum pertusum]|uniref:Uncharacterized protein n=1 Tax=Desmophyllum pertusum TaxID=174260 RepID=A0A9X0D8T7_9CNID|nr:hypothetical protein OS493_017284 [Desmophyllum pertusum]